VFGVTQSVVLLLQALKYLLEAPRRGLDWLLLELQPHHDALLQATHSHHHKQQQHINTTADRQPSCVQLLLSMAAEASLDQLQELLLRLLQIAAGRNNSSSSRVSEGAAVALHCLFWSAGPHAYRCGLILCRPRSRELLQDIAAGAAALCKQQQLSC
jgi:hypothetical protein